MLSFIVKTHDSSGFSDATVKKAIQCGLKEVKCETPFFSPTMSGFNLDPWDIEIFPPLSKVFFAARDAKDKYLTFSENDVTTEMLAPMVTIRTRHIGEAIGVRNIVLLPKGSKDGAVQPVSMTAKNSETRDQNGVKTISRISGLTC